MAANVRLIPSPRASPAQDTSNPLPQPNTEEDFGALPQQQSSSSWWDSCKGFRVGIGTICALSSVAGAVAANLYASDPLVTSISAIGSGVLAQVALETTPKKFLQAISRFNLRWSAATYLGATQVDLQCSVVTTGRIGLVCADISKEALIFLRFLSASWTVASFANRLKRTQDQNMITGTPLVEDLFAEVPPTVKMIEPNSSASFWVFKILKAGGGTALVTVTHFYPQLNFLGLMDEAGAFLIGDALITIAVRKLWQIKQEQEKDFHQKQDSTTGTIKPPFALRAFRMGGAVAETLWTNMVGALFGAKAPALYLNLCYGVIGGGLGASKFIKQQRFSSLSEKDLRRFIRKFVRPISCKENIFTGIKISLAAGVYAYLVYGMTLSPVEDMIALMSFGGTAGISWLATSMIDRTFFRNPGNRLVSSLEFYLVQSPEYLAIPFFVINQQMNIGNDALQTDPKTLQIVSCIAWGSLGAAVGQIPSQKDSPLIRAEANTVPAVAQFLATKDFVESFQGQD